MRSLKGSIALSLSLLGVAALQAQQRGSLTPEDYAKIQQLYARYAYAVDSVADTGAVLAGLFTADGVLADESGKTYTGRNQLMERARTYPGKSPTTVRHFVWNVRIAPSPSGATGKAYIVVTKVGEAGQPATVIDVGQYWDDLVKTPQGWRIKRREFHKAPPAGGGGGREGAPAGTVAVHAQQTAGSGSPTRLTADDYAQILQLYAGYRYAFDGGTNEGKVMAGLFTSDGMFGDARTGKLLKGWEALAANARGATKTPFTSVHILTNVMLIPTSDGVVGTAYRMSTSGVPIGIYFGLIVRTTEGWRFKEMHFTGPNLPVPEAAKHFLQKTAKASSSQ